MHHPHHAGIPARAVTAAEYEAAQTLVSMRVCAVAVALLGLTSHVHQSPLFTRNGAARTEVIKLFRARTKVTGLRLLEASYLSPVIQSSRRGETAHVYVHSDVYMRQVNTVK